MTSKAPATSAIAETAVTPSISGTGAANATVANPAIHKVVPMRFCMPSAAATTWHS